MHPLPFTIAPTCWYMYSHSNMRASVTNVYSHAVDLLTYPILLFNFEISSTVREVFHSIKIVFCSCHMEGSCLMERNQQNLIIVTTYK